MTEPARLEPAHVIMLRARITGPWYSPIARQAGPNRPMSSEIRSAASQLARWNRITAPVRALAETCKLPLGLILLALGKGV